MYLIDVQQALEVAEQISKKIQTLSSEQEIETEVLMISLIWAAIGIGVASGEIDEETMRSGLHLAIDSALEEFPETQTVH
tara:strand:+ start:134 stop:373 length:240 start_codon:yes stop_codon:yes gene_type:complete